MFYRGSVIAKGLRAEKSCLNVSQVYVNIINSGRGRVTINRLLLRVKVREMGNKIFPEETKEHLDVFG